MRYSMVLMVSSAFAFPFMAPDLDSRERMDLMKKTTGRILGDAAVRSAKEKRQGLLGGGLLGGGLCMHDVYFSL